VSLDNEGSHFIFLADNMRKGSSKISAGGTDIDLKALSVDEAPLFKSRNQIHWHSGSGSRPVDIEGFPAMNHVTNGYPELKPLSIT
jgi:hypothetical protein